MTDYFQRFSLLPAILLLLSTPLNAQTFGQDFQISSLLSAPLKVMRMRAADSIAHYRVVLPQFEKTAKELMGDHRLARNAFAYAPPQVYLEQFGQDTGRIISRAVEQWHDYRKRLLRWGYVDRRIADLSEKSGRQELFKRYGEKLPERLKDGKKRQEILSRELIRHSLFFHEWAEERIQRGFGGPPSGDKIRKEIKDFRSRRAVPESLATLTGGGSLPAKDIYFSYPLHQQANFYPFEFVRGTGQVALRNYPTEELRGADRASELWARWKSSKGKVLHTRAFVSGQTIAYRIPTYFLSPGVVYELSIVRSNSEAYDAFLDFYAGKDIGELINQDVYHREKKAVVPQQLFFQAYFRVSRYGSFFAKSLSHQFNRVASAGTAYQLDLEEPMAPEEITGLHGLSPQALLSYYGCPAADEVLNRLYGRAAKTFYAHPRQEYVDYLKRNRDSLDIDSLIAIEFLPLKDRLGKYRRLRMENADGQRISPFTRLFPLAPQPKHQDYIYLEGTTQPVTKALFKGEEAYANRNGSLVLRDTFAEVVRRIALEAAPLLEARYEEYVDILRQLQELSPQAGAGKDLSLLVKEINPWYLTDPRNEKQTDLQSCFKKKINTGYSLPLGAVRTTSSSFLVEE